MSSKSVLPERCAIVSSKGALQECHLSVSIQGVSQVGSLENVRNEYCLCSSTYVSAFGFVGFILFFSIRVSFWIRLTSYSVSGFGTFEQDRLRDMFIVLKCFEWSFVRGIGRRHYNLTTCKVAKELLVVTLGPTIGCLGSSTLLGPSSGGQSFARNPRKLWPW